MKTIVIGVTGSIACFKAVDAVKALKGDFNIEIIMTKNASKLMDKKEIEKALGKKVHTEMFYKGWSYKDYLKREKTEHISLADMADVFVICPATANTLGKIANGIADDLLTASVMATKAPVLICPAMNCKMWENRIVQDNVSKLKRWGYLFVEPEKGRLACGYSGPGRLADTRKIIRDIRKLAGGKGRKGVSGPMNPLSGKKIIVTAGATSEEIDPVRVITNKSSGKMGIYTAEEAARLGATVTLIRGRTDIEPGGISEDIRVKSSDDMFREIRKHLKDNDIIIHAAAVGDFSAGKVSGKKISSKGKTSFVLRLKRNRKIIEDIKKINRAIKLVGFKAEHDVSRKELIQKAGSLMKRSGADLVVANDVGKGVFGSEKNDVYILGRDGKIDHVKGSKRHIAKKILGLII
ncbi:bifunctional phosphopantothenoylcysteine decarboxylase/phosphopantothenate--cysteine ligase CoaBC [Candidatus Woesearchaeota archaeon]|nr:bifunctional phosphopantothenoylcysteine decarboxylase/phosphopantothenate--cysteine ligase CoaBC [Candidatus Woesearchaeota archaeon]